MISGWVGTALVRRGMNVVGLDSASLGVVAGVVVAGDDSHNVTHVLVGDLPPTGDYRLVPVELLTHIAGDEVGVGLRAAEMVVLPRYLAE